MNDFRRQWDDAGPDVLRAVDVVGKSGWYILGEHVRRFESALASYWSIPHAIGVASGLDALEIALRAAGLQPGDRVLTTPLSAFATTMAIVRLGGVPVFCDTTESGLMDLNEARDALRAMPGIRFLLPVHLYGFPIDPAGLRSLIDEFSLICIEDCAQSIGATFSGRPSGLTGIAAATSFYPTKNLGAIGDGGAILTADPAFAHRVRVLRDYGQSAKYQHTEIGWNSRLDELQAAILSEAFLPRLAGWTERRRKIAQNYRAAWASTAIRLLPEPEASSNPGWHLFPVRVPAARKKAFINHLRQNGIATGEHYPILIPDQEAMRTVASACFGPLTRAKALADEEVSLPIHPYLHPAEAATIGAVLLDFPEAG